MSLKGTIGIVAAALLTMQSVSTALAADIDGAWASDAGSCDKIFVKKNNRIALARNSDAYGSGFILEGNRIRGKFATCQIKKRSVDGATTQLLAACSTDIALSTTQFSLRLDDQNTLTRFFPGMPDMSLTYSRCTIR